MLGRQVVSSLRWLASARIVGQSFSWVVSIVVIRLLEPTDYGLMAMAAVVFGFVLLLNDMGLGSALVQQNDLTKSELEKVFGILLIGNVVLYLLLFLMAPLVAHFFEEPRVTSIIQVLSLRLPLISLLAVPRAVLRRNMQFQRKSLVDLSQILAGSVCTLVFAISGFGVWSLVYGALCSAVVEVIGTYIAARILVRPRFSIRGMRSQVSFGTLITVDRILWYFYSQSDIVVVGRVLGNEILGIYSMAKRLAFMPVDKSSGIVNEVAFAAYSRIQSDPEAVRSHYCKAARLTSFLSFPVFFGLSAIAPVAVPLILGEKWIDIILPLQLVALVVPLRQLSIINTPALMGIGRPDVNVINLIFAFAIMPAAFVIGSNWGIVGVSLAWLMAYPIYYLILLWRSLPVLRVSIREYLGAIGPAAGVSTIMYGGVELSRRGMTPLVAEPILVLLGVIVSGAVLYLVTTLLVNRSQLIEVVALVRR